MFVIIDKFGGGGRCSHMLVKAKCKSGKRALWLVRKGNAADALVARVGAVEYDAAALEGAREDHLALGGAERPSAPRMLCVRRV